MSSFKWACFLPAGMILSSKIEVCDFYTLFWFPKFPAAPAKSYDLLLRDVKAKDGL